MYKFTQRVRRVGVAGWDGSESERLRERDRKDSWERRERVESVKNPKWMTTFILRIILFYRCWYKWSNLWQSVHELWYLCLSLPEIGLSHFENEDFPTKIEKLLHSQIGGNLFSYHYPRLWPLKTIWLKFKLAAWKWKNRQLRLLGGVMKEQWSPLIHGMGNKELNQSSRAARLPLVRLWFRWEASRRECVWVINKCCIISICQNVSSSALYIVILVI